MTNERDLTLILRLKDEISNNLKGINSSLEKVKPTLTAMATIGTAAFAGLGLGLKASTSEASNLNESINAVNVVFKDGAKDILKFGENSAKAVGLATSEFNQMSTVTGALLKDVGLPIAEVSNLTIDLTQRAADMASVFNTDVSDAMTAINAAIRGETEPIRRFAVDVSDASLKSYLLANGIKASVTEMTQQEKKLYRTKMIFEQTKDTMNDFSNTSDEMANQQRILNAEFKNAGAELGKAFLPIIKEIQAAILPIIKQVSEWIQKNPELARNIIIVTMALTGLVTVIGTIGLAMLALSPVFTPIGLIIFGIVAAVVALIAAGTWLYQNWDTVKEKMSEIWNLIKETASNVWGSIVAFFTETIPAMITSIIDWFKQLPEKIAYALGFALGSIIKWGIDTYNYLVENVPKWIDVTVNFFKQLPGKIWEWLVSAYNSIKNWVTSSASYLKVAIPKLIDDIIGWFKELPEKMVEVGKNIVDGMKNGISDAWDSLTGWMKKMLDKFKDGVKDALGVHSPSRVMTEIGKNITQGLIVGIQSGAKELAKVADNMTSSIAVSPTISQTGSLSGGGKSIIVNITGNTLLDNQAAVKIGDQIIKTLKLNYAQ